MSEFCRSTCRSAVSDSIAYAIDVGLVARKRVPSTKSAALNSSGSRAAAVAGWARRTPGFEPWGPGLEFLGPAPGFEVWGLGFEVSGPGLEVLRQILEAQPRDCPETS